MASSSYYYNLYKEEKAKAKECEKNINSLQRILNTLTQNFYDEQSNVNAELEDLYEDLTNAVRHNSSFTIATSECNLYKELAVTADANLKNTVDGIENEISELNKQRENAKRNSSNYYDSYKDAKTEERNQALEKLKILG